ncbi:lipoate-protein ligase B [Owenweeksia hongkongensis DSM 17368]|uniref:Octanoyltransferase n=1 Tax=Owenweeksia hongkongensis (strain DSM 17368 / CIP 108786 / JCM 12287 / NRRL B-23963 / UST20020801) TaxID=926562 RepID=G8R8D4_OWEHD|nr:lipoyl(octanoyl) transferase LipB [Owenweeksia hongkongensis]AEV33527.1 lipoate-protein ligase B [Owenweeksia hongkongensis DSM 17368]
MKNTAVNTEVLFQDLGLIDYQKAWDYQEELFDKTVQSKFHNRKVSEVEHIVTQNHLLFCEHPHVYTLGKSGKPEHLLIAPEKLHEVGATYYKINRGGDITYHGPGQLVGYPILDLDHFFPDVHKYLRYLEEIFIRILADYGLQGERSPGETGVWLDVGKPNARKILALGVKASRWVTMHGWAFNVNTDLHYFKNIIPCGIDDKDVTSLEKELGHKVPMEEIKDKAKRYFAEVFQVSLRCD